MKPFPFYYQSYAGDCGPTCLKMIAEYYGKVFHPHQMKNFSKIYRRGTSLFTLTIAAGKIGLDSAGQKVNLDDLKAIELPLILHWDLHHFVVLFEILNDFYYVADPAKGVLKLKESEFMGHWQSKDTSGINDGVILLLLPK